MLSGIYFVFGIVIGSFLNVLIDRLPKGKSVIVGRSKCDYCHKTLRWFELIPVVSWMIQKGRCRRCSKRLSMQYPFIEVLTGVLFVLVSWYLSPIWLVLVSVLIVITVVDFKYQIIPDSMLITLLICSLVFHFDILTGIISGASFYALWRITKGKGMGFGDVKLAFVMGVMLGFPEAVVSFYVAFLTGAFYGVILMIQRKAGMKTKVAFGPFLVFGGLIAYFYSATILSWFGFNL